MKFRSFILAALSVTLLYVVKKCLDLNKDVYRASHRIQLILKTVSKRYHRKKIQEYKSRGIFALPENSMIEKFRRERLEKLNNIINDENRKEDTLQEFLDFEIEQSVDGEVYRTDENKSFGCNLKYVSNSWEARFQIIVGILISVATFRTTFVLDENRQSKHLFDVMETRRSLNSVLHAEERDESFPRVIFHQNCCNGVDSLWSCDQPSFNCFRDESLHGILKNVVRQFPKDASSPNSITSAKCFFNNTHRAKTMWEKGMLFSKLVSSLNRAFVFNKTVIDLSLVVKNAVSTNFICVDTQGDALSLVLLRSFVFGDDKVSWRSNTSGERGGKHGVHSSYFMHHYDDTSGNSIRFTKIDRYSNNLYSKRVPLPSSATKELVGAIAWEVCASADSFFLRSHSKSNFGITAMLYRCGSPKDNRCKSKSATIASGQKYIYYATSSSSMNAIN